MVCVLYASLLFFKLYFLLFGEKVREGMELVSSRGRILEELQRGNNDQKCCMKEIVFNENT